MKAGPQLESDVINASLAELLQNNRYGLQHRLWYTQ